MRRMMRRIRDKIALFVTGIAALALNGIVFLPLARAESCLVPTTINGVLTPIIAGQGSLSISGSDNTVSTNGTNFTKIKSGTGGSLNASSASIQTSSLGLQQFSPSTFPGTGTTNVTKTSGQSFPPGSYDTVTLSTSGSYSFDAGTYYINSLVINSDNTTLTLGDGDYYIRNFDSGQGNNNVTLNTSGVVRLFIGSSLAVHNAFDFNNSGSTTNLQIYLHPGATAFFHDKGIFNGLIYAPNLTPCTNSDTLNNCIFFHDNNTIRGAILSSSTVVLHNSNDINFSSTTVSAIANISIAGCADHYELSLPSAGRSCVLSPVKVTACRTATSPCTSVATGVRGTTLTLSSSAGTLGAKTLTFDSTGIATTTLSYPTASDNQTAEVTPSPLNAPILCCKDGNNCTVTSSCNETFSTAGCAPDHYELSLPNSGIACEESPVKVTACASSTIPCTQPFAGAAGTSIQLATDVPGAILGSATPIFDAKGIATTTLRYPTAQSNDKATVSLPNITKPVICCPTGSICSTESTCTETFRTAGLIFSSTSGNPVTPLPDVVARCDGTAASTYYLRAVETNTTTGACQAAFTGSLTAKTVAIGYQCVNPAKCAGSMNIYAQGINSQSVSANHSGEASKTVSFLSSFVNNSAPFTFRSITDVGRVKLFATVPASGSYSAALYGETSFVVAPAGFWVNVVTPPFPPLTAGEPFSVQLVAFGAGCSHPILTIAMTNFGKESPFAPTATLTSSNPLPASGNASPINTEVPNFVEGISTVAARWGEVGTISLNAITNRYLGSDISPAGKRTIVGRFRPAYFDVTGPNSGCSSTFTYSGQPINNVSVIAREKGGGVTANYDGANYSTTWSYPVTLSEVSGAAGNLTSNTILASTFSKGIATATPTFTFANKFSTPAKISLRAEDNDKGGGGLRSLRR